jgi:cytochrome c-type biogenesis protein CcmH
MDSSLEALKSQLLQLKNLHEAGAMPVADYESGKAALERRLLDAVLASPGPAQTVSAAASRAAAQSATVSGAAPSRRLLALLGIAVFAVAIGGYTLTGSPSLFSGGPPVAGAGREAGAAPHAAGMEEITEMTRRLAQRLEKQPQDAQGWAMLGRSYAVLGRNDEAVRAFQTAISQQDDDAALLADYADALAVQNKRVIAGEPMKWVRRALEIDPKNIKALALAGTEAFDRKDFAGAVQFWEKLLEFGPSDAGFVQQVEASVAEARERAGEGASGPRVAQAPAAPQAAGANTNDSARNQSAKPAPGASVSGTVSLSAALAAKAGADDTVFIFARRAEGSRMPLALLRKRVRDLPLQFTLDDSMAMSPAAKLSGAPRIIVGARISRSGDAMPAPGDLVGQVGPVALGSAGLRVEIGEQVKP